MHWLGNMDAIELEPKAQSVGLIHYGWTDALAVCCALNAEAERRTGSDPAVGQTQKVFPVQIF